MGDLGGTNKEEQRQTPYKKKNNTIRRIFKVVICIFLGVILLNLFLYILLSIPFVQDKLVGYTIEKLEERLKTEVKIDEMRVRLFDRISLKGIYIQDQQKDTLLYAKDLEIRLNPLRLLNEELQINSISLDDYVINVNRKDTLSEFNYQFIVDAFSSGANQNDTASSSLKIEINDIKIRNGRMRYDVRSDTLTPGLFNPSHIAVNEFNAELSLNSIDVKSLDINIKNISAKEESGIEVKKLGGKIYSEGDHIWTKGLSLTMPDSELSLETAEYNLANNAFKIKTNIINISPADVKAFMPELSMLNKKLMLRATLSGKIPMVELENFEMKYGDELVLKCKGQISDCLNYGNAEIRFGIDNFKASPSAITEIARLGDTTFTTPEILTNWGMIYLKGNIGGKLKGFTSNFEVWGKQGSLNFGANGMTDTTFNKFEVKARIETKGINMGNLLGTETGIGKLALHLDLNAKQTTPQNMTAQLRGAIDKFQYQDSINLNNVQITAFYNPTEIGATVNASMPLVKLQASASMTLEKEPAVRFDMEMDSLKVGQIYNNPKWKKPRLSLRMKGIFQGLEVDKMTGKVEIDKIDFHGENFTLRPDKITFELKNNTGKDRQITLNTPYLSANITGNYNLSGITDDMTAILHGYMPELIGSKKIKRNRQNELDIKVNVKNTEKISQIFELPVTIIEPLNISAQIKTINKQIEINGNAPLIRVNGMQVKGTNLVMKGIDSTFQVEGRTNIEMENGTYQIGLQMNGRDNTVHTILKAANSDTVFKINGTLETRLQFQKDARRNLITKLNIYPTNINLGKLKLQMMPATITNSDNRTTIDNLGITIAQTGKKYVGIQGVYSHRESDSLCLWFDKAQIGDLLTAFNINTIKAEIDGDIRIRNIQEHPELHTNNFKISDIVIFADTIGSLYLESKWNREVKGMDVKTSLKKSGRNVAKMAGMIYLRRDSLDLNIDIDRFSVGWAQPFLSNMLNRLDGSLSMGMKIDGKISAPHVTGFLGLNEAAAGIQYTNVTYYVSDTIKINPDYIGFNNLRVKDSEGNQATVNATVTHKDFKDMNYHVDMLIPGKLLILNTVTRTDSMFYGKVYASGAVDITGNDTGINMKMKVKNGKNSNINITVPQTSEAVDYRSVVFINVPEEKKATITAPVEGGTLPLKMAMDIEVTPDFQLGILLDPLTNTTLKANGKGLINFTYDMALDNMKVFGDYTLHEGSVKMNLQGIKSFEFKIQEGGKLKFVGDPMNTNFDITAYRRVKADLRTLSTSFEADGSTRTMVDCVLGIKGNINKMELTYDVNLPEADDDTKRKIKSLISTDEEKIRQFAYLLATNSFYNTSGGGGGGNITDGMWTNLASSTISGALNAMFGSILGQNWEVGTTLESNDGTFTNMDMSVNVSTRLFDDRLRLKTNVGYRNDMYNGGQNEFIGDFEAEYQLNKVWVLRAYNHTNDHYYRQASYTQGVGIVYTKEAKTLRQLFKSFKPRQHNKEKRNAEVNEQKNNIKRDPKTPEKTDGKQ